MSCFTKLKRPLESQSPNPTLFHNFNSLYDHYNPSHPPPKSPPIPPTHPSEPDFATVFASNRFFFSSPGRSNSIVDSADSPPSQSSNPPESSDSPVLKGSVAVPTYSPDPYLDFRRSMEEMVAARGLVDVKASWDYLHELLLCYLALNPKSTHKFIVRAFADLLVGLLASPAAAESMEE